MNAEASQVQPYNFSHAGYCPICEAEATFVANGPYFRNTLKCTSCGSSSRERALGETLARFFPKWRDMVIHECSPAKTLSAKLRRECAGYIGTQYDTSVPFGQVNPAHGFRSENLESQTFRDQLFDLVITQDVFEHLFHPDLAIREIARTLRPGGSHICTVPIVRRNAESVRLAEIVDGQIRQIVGTPTYHGNPIDKTGSLVTIAWGYDIAAYFANLSGLLVTLLNIDDIDKGIRADLNDVLICRKMGVPQL
jgi:SAM-dependent methyltransferase